MEKVNNYTYDEAIARVEAIIAAAEATSLLQYCKSLIAEMHQDIPV